MFAPPPPPSPDPGAITTAPPPATMGILPSPRRESPGERASAAGPAGRSKAGSFRRSGQQNAVSVKKNGRFPPAMSSGSNSAPPSLPPQSRLPAPPPPNDPPPSAPPPRAPHERDEDVSRRLQAALRKDSKSVKSSSPVRASTPPKRPPRPSSALSLERPLDSPLRQLRAMPTRASTTSCASRGTSPLRQMTTARQMQTYGEPRPLSGLSEMVFAPAVEQEAHTAERPPNPTRVSVKSLKRPPLTEESINAAAAQMIKDKEDSSSTMSSFAMSSVSLPYPLISPPQASPTPLRAVSLTSLRHARSTFLGRSRSSNIRRHARKHSSLETRSSNNRSMFTKRMHASMSGHSTSARPEFFHVDDLRRIPERQSGVAKSVKPMSPTVKLPGRRKRKGETMSMLLDDGFFPVEELVYSEKPPMAKAKNRYTSMAGFKINLPPRLSFIESNSPMSPSSPPTPGTPGTPDTPRNGSETPATPRSARNRRNGGAGQTVLPQISESEDVVGENRTAKADCDQTSPSKSQAKPEPAKARDERPPSPGTVAPVATQIQLRNGSIVTLTPPELTAWQPTLYLHGPIKLPKPTIMPRKNSVATLDPFQDAIEKLYQDTLAIPRRRSDDAVVDDICEYFDAFGFDFIGFAGDDFADVDFGVGEVRDFTLDVETFSTPPMEPTVITPAEATIANEMLERSNSPPSPALQAPPVENEETLRARGIARLSRGSAGATPDEGRSGRKESITLGKPQTSAVLPLSPAPETSMLDAVLQPGQRDSRYSASVYSQRRPDGASGHASSHIARDNASLHTTRTSSSGVRRSTTDVEEMMSAESALTGNAKPVISAPTGKESKLSRVRRLVASASSIL